MSFPKYEAYKDSGVEWLGEVPEHWEMRALRRVISMPLSNGIFKKKEDFGEGTLLVNVFDIYRPNFKVDFGSLDRVRCTNQEVDTYLVLPGDLLFVRSSLKQEGIAAVAMAASCPENLVYECHLIRARPDKKLLDGRFGSYILNSVVYRSSLIAKSKITTMTTIDQEAILSTSLPIPPVSEQIQIACFLDHEIARIDASIAEQERLIELLKEKRQAVISHAVTKGLDRTVPMKDSGVEWLGEVPENWTVGRIKNLVQFVIDGPHFSPSYTDEGILFISARNVRIDGWSFSDAKFISQSDYEEFSKRVKPMRGDVLLTKGGTTGVARAVDFDEPFQVWVHIAVLRPKHDVVIPEYLAYSLNSVGCYEQSQLYTRGATNNDLGLTRIVNIQLAWTSLEEQKMIVHALDKKVGMFDESVSEAKKTIELLQERRSALISAAVTGKIDVRGWKAPERDTPTATLEAAHG